MLLKNHWFSFAPSGTSAEAGEITDEEVGLVPDVSGTETVEPEVEAEPQLPSLEDAFKAHGLNLPADPKELDRKWRDMEARSAQAADAQNRLNWMLHQQGQAQAEAQRRAQTEQQQKPRPKVFDLPEYDPKWLDLVMRNEAGELVAKPGAMPDLPQKINAYAAAREEAMNRFLSDPMGLMQEHMGGWVQEQASQIAQQQMHQYVQAQELRRFEAENKAWVFADGTGETSRELTPAAHHWNAFYREALQAGFPDPKAIATDRFDALLYRLHLQQEAQKQDKVPTTRDKDEAFLEAAAKKPGNRTGTFPSKTKTSPVQNAKDPWGALEERVKSLPPEDFAKD